jgi:hypothetical protein
LYVLKNVLPQRHTFETSLPILRDLIAFDLAPYAGLVIPFLAARFLKFSREDLLNSVNPQALSKILPTA